MEASTAFGWSKFVHMHPVHSVVTRTIRLWPAGVGMYPVPQRHCWNSRSVGCTEQLRGCELPACSLNKCSELAVSHDVVAKLAVGIWQNTTEKRCARVYSFVSNAMPARNVAPISSQQAFLCLKAASLCGLLAASFFSFGAGVGLNLYVYASRCADMLQAVEIA